MVGSAIAVALAMLSDGAIAVLPPDFGQSVPAWAHGDLEQDLLAGLRREAGEVVPPQRVADETRASGCVEPTCWAAAGDALGVRYFVRARVAAAGRDYTIALDIVDSRDGRVVVDRAAECDVCGVEEVRIRLADEAAALHAALLALPTVEVAPAPAPSPSPEHRPPPSNRRIHPGWGWSTLAAGVVGLAAGIALIVLDERPHEPTCEMPDMAGRCPRRWNTLGAGIGVTVASVVVLTTGAVLLGLTYRRRPARARARLDGPRLRF
jgi:hypothetical protein